MPSMMGTMKAMKAQVPKETLAELGVEAGALAGRGRLPGPGGAAAGDDARRARLADVAAQLVKLLREQSRVL